MMEEYTPGSESDESQTGQLKQWIQENLRIIVSIFIVVVIAGGIYSYSKRSDNQINKEESVAIEEKIEGDDVVQIAEDSQQETKESAESIQGEKTKESTESTQGEEAKPIEKKEAEVKTESPKENVSSAATSKETTEAFIETAAEGNGTTHLARRALANYLEKNPDSALTKEHKIYIEDYLRKNIGHRGNVYVGTQIEFSKSLIQKSIEQSKKLSEGQLKNLQKYSSSVSVM